MKAVILAGGGGTRLWPVSRHNRPKQLQPFLDDETLLEKTFKRVRRVFAVNDILIATNQSQLKFVKAQLPKFTAKNFIVEPCQRDTAAAIGLAAVYLHRREPQANFVTINSDHYIKSEDKYLKVLRQLERVIEHYPEQTILVGVRPTYPETGYGYIKKGRRLAAGLYQVEKFVEKPDLATAKKYLASGQYLWNPALFSWRADHLLNLYRQHLPALYYHLKKIETAIGSRQESAVLRREFAKIQPISVDYGLLEKISGQILVVEADYQFTDIGHWETLRRVLADERGNVIKGLSVVYDSDGNLIYNFTKRLIATAGLKNTIIVQTDDALFVCPRERAQDAKKVVELLQQQGLVKYL